MKERGIIFSAPMVRALLAGTKTQTRRLATGIEDGDAWPIDPMQQLMSPRFGGRGDRLWVRESFGFSAKDPESFDEGFSRETHDVIYRATAANHEWDHYNADGSMVKGKAPWRSPLFMPRWASRITLEITGVRVERLQAITEEDAKAEGVTPIDPKGNAPYVVTYASLWDSLHGKKAPWSSNPLVWCVAFRLVDAAESTGRRL